MWFVNCELCARIVSCHGQKILIDIFGVHFKQFKSENCTPKSCTTIPTPSTPAPTLPPPATPTRCDVIVSQPWQAVYLFSQPQKCSREGQQILLLVFRNSGEMEKKSKGVRKRWGGARGSMRKFRASQKLLLSSFTWVIESLFDLCFGFSKENDKKAKRERRRKREGGKEVCGQLLRL